MTDRELLEFAAKAAGMKCRWWKVKEWEQTSHASGVMCGRMFKGGRDVFGTHHSKPWNPLDDDGDAFRLAVKLGIRFQRIGHKVCAIGREQLEEYCDTDQYKATRRAITSAAAEIGKRMP